MKLTKNIISRKKVLTISSSYVAFAEGDCFDKGRHAIDDFEELKRGQRVITYMDGKFIIAKITSVDTKSFKAIDGPVVRVSNGEYSWRVDGDAFAVAYPEPKKTKKTKKTKKKV